MARQESNAEDRHKTELRSDNYPEGGQVPLREREKH